MKRTQKLARTLVIIGITSAFGILSKPDRGGVNRCSNVFSIPKIKELGLTHKAFVTWEFFESPKFRFTISSDRYTQLAVELERIGYSEWKRGGVTFGSVSEGWEFGEDHIYCELTRDGYHYYWSYSERENLIYAITFST